MASEREGRALDDKSATVCRLCRQRKTKCDRALPRCGFCVRAKVTCQYLVSSKKRGLRAGYVTHLENRIDALQQEVADLRDECRRPLTPPPILGAAVPHEAPRDTTSTPGHSLGSGTPFPGASSARSHQGRAQPAGVAAAAEEDLMTLPPAYLYTLADLWFKETHPWLPILSQSQIQNALHRLPVPVSHIDDVVLKAVIALQLKHSSQAICLGYHGRLRLSQHLRLQVIDEALSRASLPSLQALLIMAILDYGADNIPSTFSLLSVCRRMCENIGLFRKLLTQMELQSPAQVGPPAVDGDGGDELAVPLTWATLALDAVSTLGIPWRDVSAALVDHLSSVAYVSTPDLKDSFRSHTHLAAIALQPLHTFIFDHEHGKYDLARDEALATCDEIYTNLMSYVGAQPATSYTLLADGGIDYDPNLVLTAVLSHAGSIVMYQRLVDFDPSAPSHHPVPLQRCLRACEEVVTAVRGISDADAELSAPLLAHLLFVAARFKLLAYRHLPQRREPIFDTLMHGISMCGRRWEQARRLDMVLRAAIAELDGDDGGALPATFWQVRKTHLDISEEMKAWGERPKHSLYFAALNGPY